MISIFFFNKVVNAALIAFLNQLQVDQTTNLVDISG
jgi:hypothetical protein